MNKFFTYDMITTKFDVRITFTTADFREKFVYPVSGTTRYSHDGILYCIDGLIDIARRIAAEHGYIVIQNPMMKETHPSRDFDQYHVYTDNMEELVGELSYEVRPHSYSVPIAHLKRESL